jgi:peroxiredoxin
MKRFCSFLFKPHFPSSLPPAIVLACFAAGLFAWNAAAPSTSAQDQAHFPQLLPEAARQAAPGFSLTDADGKPITLSAYRGKVVLLDFWATWCGGCKREIPWYIEFDKKYRDKGLAAIGVSMDDEGWKAVRPFLAKKIDTETGGNVAMQYPVVIGNQQLATMYHLTAMPMTLLIDRQGRIALSYSGVVNKDDFEQDIRQLLN